MSVCIPHKENLVKPSLTYFTAMARAPEEYAVRRNGLRLFLSHFTEQELVLFNQGVSGKPEW